MGVKIYPAAKEQILDIWIYTEKTWGREQADRYVDGIVSIAERAQQEQHRWRRIFDEKIKSVFFVRYRHHYVFFRELSKEQIGIISVLHENMDFPSRLKNDIEHDI